MEKVIVTNQLQIFNNPDFGDVRIVNLDKEPWIVGRDAATALGYSNPNDALAKHVSDKFKLVSQIAIAGQKRNVTLINEAGLYKLIMRSKLPNAEKFSDWCCGEVLPSIRKTGFYATQEKIDDIVRNPDRFIEELMSAYNRVKLERDEARAQVAVLQPATDYCDNVLKSDEHLTSELIAKEYGKPASWLHQILIKYDVIYKRGRLYFLKAKFSDKGYRISETITLDGGKSVVNHYWTQKGRNFIYNFLKGKGIVPTRERAEIVPDLFRNNASRAPFPYYDSAQI